MQAWFPTGEPIHGHGSCPPTSLPTGFSEWGLGHISHAWKVPHSSYVGCVYNVYVFSMDSSLEYYEVTFWVSFYGPFFEVYFVWCKYRYSSFFLLTICSEYLFLAFTFSLCRSFVLRWVSCRQRMCGSCFLIHSAILCLLTGAFNPFMFKVIVDRYLFTAISSYLCSIVYAHICFLIFRPI